MGFRLSTLLTICWRAGCPLMLARICARICASCQKKGIYSASSDICFTRNPFLPEQCFTLILRHTCLRTALKRQTNKKPWRVLKGKGNITMVSIRVHFTDLWRTLLELKWWEYQKKIVGALAIWTTSWQMKSPRDKSNYKGLSVIYSKTTAVLLKRTPEEKAQLNVY